MFVGVFVGVGVGAGMISTPAQDGPSDGCWPGSSVWSVVTLAQFCVSPMPESAMKSTVIVRVFPASHTAGLPSAGECSRLFQVSVPEPVDEGAGLAEENDR